MLWRIRKHTSSFRYHVDMWSILVSVVYCVLEKCKKFDKTNRMNKMTAVEDSSTYTSFPKLETFLSRPIHDKRERYGCHRDYVSLRETSKSSWRLWPDFFHPTQRVWTKLDPTSSIQDWGTLRCICDIRQRTLRMRKSECKQPGALDMF